MFISPYLVEPLPPWTVNPVSRKLAAGFELSVMLKRVLLLL